MVINKHFSKYYLKYIITFLLGTLALIVVDYAQLKIPEVIGKIIDGIHEGTKDNPDPNLVLTKQMLISYMSTFVMTGIVLFIGRFLWRICIFGNGVKIETDIRNEMFAHMEYLPQTYYERNKTGSIMAFYTNDLSKIRQAFAGGTLMLVDATALGVLAFIKMYKLSPKLTLVSLVPLVIVGIFSMFIEKVIKEKSRKNLEAYDELSDFVQEDFSGIHVVKAFVKEKRKRYLFEPYNQKNAKTAFDFKKTSTAVYITIDALLVIMLLTIIFVGGLLIYQAQSGQRVTNFTVGNLTTFNSYFDSLIWPILAIGDLINLRAESKAAEKRIGDFLDEVKEVNDDLVTEEIPEDAIKGKIEYRGVSFNYPGYDVQVLKDASFTINQGEMVGIMGGTGEGKTTIVELLLRLYNLEENKILLDGYDIMKIPVKMVRENIAYVPQDTFLFKQTVAENIAFAKESVEIDKVKEVAKVAGIAKDVEEFVDGYDTIVGERGVTVSGGQKQRISIARALIKEAPILILDDSLSAVDTITEDEILKELRKSRKNMTTIIIAHRITTLETLDKIIVIDDGKISDIGTHEELIERNPIYKREVRLQELEKEQEGF